MDFQWVGDVATGVGIIAASGASVITANRAKRMKNVADEVGDDRKSVIAKLDLVIESIRSIEKRVGRLEHDLREHINWHLERTRR